MCLRAFLAALALAIADEAAGASRPHIIMVLTDDLGWNTAWNNPDIHSPTLNSMAAAGVKLTSHYTYRFCSPSRAAFLTGRSPYKLLNIRENMEPATVPEATDERFTMLPKKLKEAGYYSYLIGKWHQGFRTHSVTPVGRGFDESFGFLHGGEDHFTQVNEVCGWGKVTDYWQAGGEYGTGRPISDCNVPLSDRQPCPLFLAIRKNSSVDEATKRCKAGHFANCDYDKSESENVDLHCFMCKPKRYTGYDFTNHAVKIIEEHSGKHPKEPMFMYLALHNTHGPIQAPDEFVALYNYSLPKRNTFNAMVSVVDSTVANVTAALKKAGLWDNCLFVWTTDNGTPVQVAGSNAPLRGTKGSGFEGGTRVPTFISGGILPSSMSGKTLDGIVAFWDFFTTFCVLAGADPKEANPKSPTPVDGVDVWPYLSGQRPDSPRTEIVFDHLAFDRVATGACFPGDEIVQVAPCHGTGALRVGDYKLMVGVWGKAGHYGHFSPNETWSTDLEKLTLCSVETPCLFNVKDDMAEEHDLASSMPDKVAELMERFHAYDDEYHPPSAMPDDDAVNFCNVMLNNGGFSMPWQDVAAVSPMPSVVSELEVV
mmetsp:Transcript_30384/g.66561  ORF Transcript_30384/g.66561 Transcript_30384/m.66561 type:complete len:596 (+) Transcript_30384:74-1861(+)